MEGPEQRFSVTRRATRYLTWVAVGLFLGILDLRVGFKYGGNQVGFDVLPDWVGLVAIACGTLALSRINVSKSYEILISFAAGLSLAWVGVEIVSWLSPEAARLFQRAAVVLGPLATLGPPLVAEAMRRMALKFEARDLAGVWRRCAIGFLLFWTTPVVLQVTVARTADASRGIIALLFVIPTILAAGYFVFAIQHHRRAARRSFVEYQVFD